MIKILIIEDDPQIIEAIYFLLQVSWPEADLIYANKGEEGLELIEKESPQLVIVDLGLPDISGFEVIKRIRLFSKVGIVILSVCDEDEKIVKGLKLGADEYVIKPIRPMEFITRLRKVVEAKNVSLSTIDDMCLDYGFVQIYTNRIKVNGESEKISYTESLILHSLISNIGMVVPYEKLAETIWEIPDSSCKNAIRVYIRQLRKKIEKDPGHPQLIITHSNTGYMLVKPPIKIS
ncbi:MAG: response regulator transcription factor [Eubacteriales bacterium]